MRNFESHLFFLYLGNVKSSKFSGQIVINCEVLAVTDR